ncbi:MAG: helix-hairpin-helix domain-containing protein [Acidobacteriota bacterium]
MNNLTVKTLLFGLAIGLLFQPLFSLQAGQKAADQKVNINTASLEELQTLPRIGPGIAQRIIDHRKENGNFKKIEEIMKVRGIGEKVFNQLKDRITVGAEAAGK